jgi:hypothetical protein
VGGSFTKQLKDAHADSFRISEHLVVPESKHTKTLRLEPVSACLIALRRLRVLSAIDLQDAAPREADEIDDVRTKRDLPPKSVAGELLSSQE